MRSLLIRCYPARWRARYGDEFAAHPRGAPARPVRRRGHPPRRPRRPAPAAREAAGIHERGLSMSLRIGGIAAILGAPSWRRWFLGDGARRPATPCRRAICRSSAGARCSWRWPGSAPSRHARPAPLLGGLRRAGDRARRVQHRGVRIGRSDRRRLLGCVRLGVLTVPRGLAALRDRDLLHGGLRAAAVLLGDRRSWRSLRAAAGFQCDPARRRDRLFTLGWFVLGVQAIRLDRPVTRPARPDRVADRRGPRLDRPSLDEPTEPALTDEGAVADRRLAADEDRADGPRDLDPLVRRVVARVVEVGGADRPRRAAGSKRTRSASLPTSSAPLVARPNRRAGVVASRSTIRSTVIRPVATPSPYRIASSVSMPGRAVADLVERHAAGGVGLLDRHPVRDVVRRDEVERAVGEARPQRVAVGGGAERRRDDVAGAADRDRARRRPPR